MNPPARHPSPVGRTAPRVGDGLPVTTRAATFDGEGGVDCRAGRPTGRVTERGTPSPELRALRERAGRCLHGRDYGKAALLYRLAEYFIQETDGPSPSTTELAALAEHCEQLTQAHAKKGRTTL